MIKLNDIPPEMRPSIDDLPGDLSRIAHELDQHLTGEGVNVAILLAQLFRGQPLYIRNIDSLLRKIRDDAIKKEYDEGSVTMLQLASKWGLGHRRIKQILSTPNS